MNTAGRTFAIDRRACRAVLYESAAGVNGNPYDILNKIKRLKSFVQLSILSIL